VVVLLEVAVGGFRRCTCDVYKLWELQCGDLHCERWYKSAVYGQESVTSAGQTLETMEPNLSLHCILPAVPCRACFKQSDLGANRQHRKPWLLFCVAMAC